MRTLLRPILVPLLRRDPGEVARRARDFHIDDARGRTLVERLGEAFLGGFNAMLEARDLDHVVERGRTVADHFRPFFFEGAAMGYLPRGYFASGFTVRTVERDLLQASPEFLYLYYVGLGFWYGIRHGRRPAALLDLAPHVNPLYFPLCFDGFGFKTGFFDYPRDGGALERIERCPERYRRFAYQGFGRSMFFLHMNDPAGFEALCARLGPGIADDLECGRSLALGFTGVDRPAGLLGHLDSARDDAERGARLTGVAWALAARRMNDRVYFDRCLEGAGVRRAWLATLPDVVDRVLAVSDSYDAWQRGTRAALLEHWAAGVPAGKVDGPKRS